MRQIILASQSPRRKELLARMGVIDFERMPSDFYEELDDSRSPQEVAMELGLGKAKLIAEKYPEAIVIGSDTIVARDGRQLAKAADDDEAREMLRSLSGGSSIVVSSLAVLCIAEGFRYVDAETTTVQFKPYDETLVNTYIATGDYKDKAGAYGIQSGAAPLIASISGYPDVVVGFPTHSLAPVLRHFGFEAQPVDYKLDPNIQIKTN